MRWSSESATVKAAFSGAMILHLNAKLKKAALPHSACFSQVEKQIQQSEKHFNSASPEVVECRP